MDVISNQPELIFSFNDIPSMLHVIDNDGYIISVTDFWLSKLGYSREEVIGVKSIDFLCSKSKNNALDHHFPSMGMGLTIIENEVDFKCKNGSIINTKLSAKANFDNNNNLLGHTATIIDVTKEKSLLESEKTFRELFDNSNELIYIMNLKGKFIDVNKTAIQTYGYSKEFIIGKTPEIFDAKGLNDLEKLNISIKAAINGTPSTFDWWGKKKNGEIFPKEVNIRKGSYFGEEVLITVSRDVTEKKNSEEKYKSIFNSLIDVYYKTNANGEIIELSPSVFDITGYHPDDIKNKLFFETFSSPVYREAVMEEISKTGELSNFPIELQHKSGAIIDAELNAKAIFDDEGVYLGNVGIARNVTEKNLQRKALKESEKKYKSIFNSLTDIYYKTNANSEIIEVSPSCFNSIGLKQHELIGEIFDDNLVGDIEREKLRREIKEKGILKNYPISVVHSNGSIIDFELNFNTVLNKNNEFNGIVGLARDVTERNLQSKLIKENTDDLNRVISQVNEVVFSLIYSDDEKQKLNTFAYLSENIFEYTGYTTDEILVNPSVLDGRIPREDLVTMMRLVKEIVDTKRSINREYRFKHKNGKTIWIEDTISLKNNILYGSARIITERKIAELELKILNDKVEHYKDLMFQSNKLAKVGAWEVDSVKQTVFWDDNTKEILEVPLNYEPNMETILNFYKEGQNRNIIKDATESAQKTGKGYDIISEAISGEGRPLWLRSIGKAIPENGEFLQFYGAFQDVTEKKLAEIRLRNSEKMLSTLIKSTDTGYCIANTDSSILEANTVMMKMLGENRLNKIIGKKISEYTADYERKRVEKDIKKLLKDKKINNLKYTLKNGVIVIINASFVETEEGEKIMLLVRDMTEFFKQEGKLTETKNKFEAIFNSLIDVYYKTNKNGEILNISPSIINLVGKTPEEILGKQFATSLAPLINREIIIDELMNKGKLENYPMTLSRKNGEKINVELNSKVIVDEKGNYMGSEGIIRDVTTRVLQDEIIQINEKILRKLHKKNTEIIESQEKTKMTAIIQAQDEERARISRDVHDGLGQLLTASKMRLIYHLSEKNKTRDLIEETIDILDTAQNESKRIAYDLLPSVLIDFGLYAGINKSVKFIESTSNININLINNFETDMRYSKEIETNFYRIAQESLNNAIKYSEADNLNVTLTQKTKRLELIIEDDGIGFNFNEKSNLVKKEGEDLIGNGILNMFQRAKIIGAKMKIKTKKRNGTKISVKIKIK